MEVPAMVRSLSRSALPFVTALLVAGLVVQVFLAGLGVFESARTFITHRDFGYMLGMLILAVAIVAAATRSRRMIGLSLLLLLQITLQSVFVGLRADMPQIAALHPLNGFLILLVSVVLTRDARQLRELTRAEAAAAADAPDRQPAASTEVPA
jgi:hypothetical protein